jgi:hypothetical protein
MARRPCSSSLSWIPFPRPRCPLRGAGSGVAAVVGRLYRRLGRRDGKTAPETDMPRNAVADGLL